MNNSCEKIILGLIVLDKIIPSSSDNLDVNKFKKSDLTLGGPPTFMIFIAEILSEVLSVIQQPTIFSYVSRQTKKFLDGISDGTINLAYRRWRRPTVREGSSLLAQAGKLQIKSVFC